LTSEAPNYSLDELRRVAEKPGKIQFERTAEVDRQNLEYSCEEVARCIQALTHDEFHKTLGYEEKKGKKVIRLNYDVYKTLYTPSFANEPDYLYMKLRLCFGVQIIVGSFKQA